MAYAETELSAGEIARELGVGTLVEGGVQTSGGRIRLNVQLIDPQSDEHLWAETYDREITAENVFAIQSEIASAIAERLEAELTPETRAALADLPTDNIEAWNAYNRAKKKAKKKTKKKNAVHQIAMMTPCLYVCHYHRDRRTRADPWSLLILIKIS